MYFIIIDKKQVGPLAMDQLLGAGLTPDTYVWKSGMADWQRASQVAELAPLLAKAQSQQNQQSQYQQQQNQQSQYQQQPPQYRQTPYNQYNQQYGDHEMRSPNLPMAIIATVLGLFSCLGLIFGICAIVKVNKANRQYSYGNVAGGQREDRTARTFAIVGMVLGAVGLLVYLITIHDTMDLFRQIVNQ
jgi:hypothetical protein